jgi:hypothetical protein
MAEIESLAWNLRDPKTTERRQDLASHAVEKTRHLLARRHRSEARGEAA